MNDPTILGVPNDQIVHSANMLRARDILLDLSAWIEPAECIAEALTAAETRGFAAGVASTVRRNCFSCAYDVERRCRAEADGIPTWFTRMRLLDLADEDYPHPTADGCPGWAAKETT